MMEAIRLVARRADFLHCLSASPHDKRELVEKLDYSRSTVDRAVRDLEVQGFVERVDGGYTTTLSGRVCVEQYHQFVETSTDALRVQDIVDKLPPDTPIDGRLLRDASVHSADTIAPDVPVDHLLDRLDGADRLCVLAASLPHPRYVDRVVERSRTDGLVTEFFLAEPLLVTVQRDGSDTLTALLEADVALSIGDVPPFDLHLVVDGSETVVQAVVPNDTGSAMGVISNDTPAAVEWATSQLSTVRDTARPVSVDATESDETSAAANEGSRLDREHGGTADGEAVAERLTPLDDGTSRPTDGNAPADLDAESGEDD